MAQQERLPPAAVLVVHGMGQQVPFETLGQVYGGLRREEMRIKGKRHVGLEPKAKQSRVGAEHVRRLEIELWDAKGRVRPVHLYEGYWAPLTEGRVGLRDVVGFLLSAGFNGLRNAKQHVRWVFGQESPTPTGGGTVFALLFALLVVLGLAAIDLIVLAAAGALLGNQAWPGAGLRSDLTWLVGVGILLPALLFGLTLKLGRWGRDGWRRRVWEERAKSGEPRDDLRPSLWHRFWDAMASLLFALTAFLIVVVPVVFGVIAAGRRFGYDPVAALGLPVVPSWLVFALLVGLAYVSYKVRHVLVQSVGDVAAYVQTHKLDRFHELRNEIKRKIRTVADAIYSQRNGKGFLYERVAIVGHSLGSVVAYNTLNDLLNDDEDLPAKEKRRVSERTRLLMTFGSPLDKLAFVFATQRHKTSWAREQLVGRAQPLIFDYDYRTRTDWVNVYAKRDIIAGSLDLYDANPHLDPRPPADYRPVHNVEDVHARIPLLAHNEYWMNPRIWYELRRRIVD